MENALKIVELRSEFVKRLNVLVIRPKGNVVVLQGENGVGKSSAIDSIEMALTGKVSEAPIVIQQGQEYAEVKLDLGAFTVRKRWTKGGTVKLLVEMNGFEKKAPQTFLDEMLGKISFDPLAFIRLDPKKQAEIVKRMVGVDTSKLEADYKVDYDKRTQVSNSGKSLKARFDALPVPPAETPDEPVNVQALLDEQTQLQAVKSDNDRLRGQLAVVEESMKSADTAERQAEEEVQRLEKTLNDARAKLEVTSKKRLDAHHALDDAKQKLGQLIDPDIAGIYRKIASADATNTSVRQKKERAAMGAELDKLRDEKIALDAKLDALLEEKAKLIREAKFPIDGMSFDSEGGLTFSALPLVQASSAEQLRIGVALCIALNPKIRIAFIRDGSLLDEKSMDLVEQMADQFNMQIWIERVGKGPVGFEIVDGYVVAVDGVPVEQPEPDGDRRSKKEQAQVPADISVGITVPQPQKSEAAADPGKPVLSLVPNPPPEPEKPKKEKREKVRGTFKDRQISDLSPDELRDAVIEVEASINAAPLAQKSTRARAVLEDLKSEQQKRMDAAIAAAPSAEVDREPGSDG